jgi:hypothetical protein
MERPAELAQDSELVAHEQTYKAFNLLVRWSMLALGSSLLMLTLWFATPAGFLGALITGVLVFALGYLLLVRQEERAPLEPGQ